MLVSNTPRLRLGATHAERLVSSSRRIELAVQHTEYLPFGEELLNQSATSYSERYTFTGKELDEESNLYYYDARYNSSTYSQFNSIDPMSDKYPSVNPYLYCAGNPIKYVDPDGMDIWEMDKNGYVINRISDETKDAFRMNGKEIAFNHGTVIDYSDRNHTTEFWFKDGDAALSAFKFLADNSNAAGSLVEFGVIVAKKQSCLFTNHRITQIGLKDMIHRIHCNITEYGDVLEAYHNHPSSLPPSGFKPGDDEGDKYTYLDEKKILKHDFTAYVYKSKFGALEQYDGNQRAKENISFNYYHNSKGTIKSQSPSWLFRLKIALRHWK